MENQISQREILRTQKVLSDYIDFKKDKETFTKYVEESNGRPDKENNKRSPSKK